MKINPLLLLQSMKAWQLWLFSVILSILLTEIIVASMDLLLKRELFADYLLTGLVASCLVASVVVTLLGYLLEKLSESQLQLQAIIEAEPECVKLLAADGTLLQMNPAGLNMIEADSLAQVAGRQLQQLLMPEYRKPFVNLMKRVFEGESGNLEFEIQGLKGTRRWLDTHAVPLRDTHGHITALLAVTRDITERKAIEEQLRDNEAFTNSILNSLASHIAVLDKHGTIIAVNNTWKQFAEENDLPESSYNTIGTNYFQVCQKAFNEGQLEEAITVQYGIMAVLAGTRDIFQLEYPCHSPAQKRWFYMRVLPLKGAQHGVVISHENITHRKEMEEALKASEAKFRSIIDVSPVPMALNDNHGNIIFLNPAFVQTFGYELTDIPTLADWWPKAYPDPEYRQWVADSWQAALEQAEREHRAFIPIELAICSKNGTEKTVLVSAAAISESFKNLHLVVLYDISERKQAELAKRASEKQLRAFYELDLVGLTITSPEKGWIRINECLCKMLEYSEQELHQMTWAELTHPDDLAADVAQFEKLLANEIDRYALEKRFITRTGKVVFTQLVVRCVRKTNGEVDYVLAMVQDITEHKHAVEALQQSAAHISMLMNSVAEGIYGVDMQGNCTFINAAGLHLLGYQSESELLGKHMHDTIHHTRPNGSHYPVAECLLYGCLRSHEAVHVDDELFWRKDGSYFAVDYWSRPITENSKSGAVVTFLDITQRKQIETELRELNRDFVTFLENTSDFIYFKDQDSRIRFCSQTLANITQQKSWRDLVGKHDLEIFPPETAQIYYNEELPVFEQGLPLLNKIDPYYHEDGTKGWVSTSKWPVFDYDNHKVIGIFGISRDITQLKQAELNLLRSNADLEQFAYSVSHDMRQPLRSVTGHLQLLLRSLQDKLDADERINLNFALEGAKRMDAMILSLLDYSRVGRKTENKAWISSRATLDEALEFLMPAVEEAKLEVKITGEWGEVFASHDELTRLFMNLIGNAIKYREANQPPLVEIDSVVTANSWKVSVRDYGIGIDPSQIDRLFQFFSRLQSRTRFDGTGMGLALCRRIVEHHDGKIWVESAGEQQGSCFIFELPLPK